MGGGVTRIGEEEEELDRIGGFYIGRCLLHFLKMCLIEGEDLRGNLPTSYESKI